MDDYIDGLRHVRADLLLFFFALFSIVPRISAQMLNVMVVGFSKDILKAGSAGFGLLDMAYGVGAMVCGSCLPLFMKRFELRPYFPTLVLVFAAFSSLAVSYSGGLAVAAIGLALFGACSHMVGILASTELQREVSSDVIGRINSTIQVCQYLFIPPIVLALGQYASLERGFLLHETALRDSFVAAALLLLLLAGVSCFTAYPFLKNRLGQDPSEGSPSSN